MEPSELNQLLQDNLPPLVEGLTEWGLQVIGAIAVLIIGRWIAARLRRATANALERSGTDATLIPFLSSGVYYVALAVVLIAVLNLFGVETTSLVAVLGAAGLAVGLALQGSLSNFAAGVMLLVFRPVRVGDYVEVADAAGTVREIGIFTTRLDTPDNVHVIVPNSKIFDATIKNYSHNETRRIDLVAGISYADDIPKAISVLQRVLSEDARVLAEPEPLVAVSQLGDSSVNLVVRPWCARTDYWRLRFDLLQAIKEQLEAEGCSIPFPQRDVHLYATNGASTP